MNRFLALLICLVVPAIGYGESCSEYAEKIGVPRESGTGKVVYQEVVPLDGVTGPQIYSQAKAAIAILYKSADAVIQLDDKDAGRLVAKGNFPMGTRSLYVNHTVTIEAKDGRYRVTITDLVADGAGFETPIEETLSRSSCFGNKNWIDDIHQGGVAVMAAVRAEMSKAGGNDW